MKEEINDILNQYITEKRSDTFDKVLDQRTKYISVVLENIYQPHNASAVLRSCDCFGIQDVHIIENNNKYTVSEDVALGSSKWVSMHHYNKEENNTLETIRKLKSEGYRIIATSPHANDVDLYDFDVTKGKSAIVFGTELTGISEIVKQEADEFVKIPMYGFTESFNISVSAALMLQHLSHQIRSTKVDWELTQNERSEIRFGWLKSSIKRSEVIVKELLKKNNGD